MSRVDPDLLEWAQQIHNAVATLASYAPGGGRAMPALKSAKAAILRVIEKQEKTDG